MAGTNFKIERKKITVPTIVGRKREGRQLVMLTAYDATFARLVDACDIDIILVGDSLGMVVQGREHTLEVTLDEMIYHSRAVCRGTEFAHVVLDLPFMSYQVSPEQALETAGRAIKEGGAHSVKMEGGATVEPAIRKIVQAGIPVMGHLGLTPQSVHAFGGFRVQARDTDAADRLRADALRLQDAGCYAIVLEGIPADLAREVSESLKIPTIGIGAGPGCDGQVLVMHDLLGLDDGFRPRFVKRFAELAQPIRDAFSQYADEVRDGTFPALEHSFAAVPGGKSAAKDKKASGGYGPR